MQAKFVACFSATTQAIWLRNLIKELTVFDFVDRPIQLYCDSNSAVLFINNNRGLKGSKHMEVKYLTIKEKVQKVTYSINSFTFNKVFVNVGLSS